MKTNNKHFFKVIAKCGHVGRQYYIPIAFPVAAENGKEAAAKVREFPRVKHHKKDAIISCDEITYKDYKELKKINSKDPYLKCHRKAEQKLIPGFEERIVKPIKQKIDKKEVRFLRKQVACFKIRKAELAACWSY